MRRFVLHSSNKRGGFPTGAYFSSQTLQPHLFYNKCARLKLSKQPQIKSIFCSILICKLSFRLHYIPDTILHSSMHQYFTNGQFLTQYYKLTQFYFTVTSRQAYVSTTQKQNNFSLYILSIYTKHPFKNIH